MHSKHSQESKRQEKNQGFDQDPSKEYNQTNEWEENISKNRESQDTDDQQHLESNSDNDDKDDISGMGIENINKNDKDSSSTGKTSAKGRK